MPSTSIQYQISNSILLRRVFLKVDDFMKALDSGKKHAIEELLVDWENTREILKKTQGLEVKDIDKKLTYDDYINYGMIKQFMARMKVFIYLDKNTKESLINIMKNSDVSALKTEIVRHLSEDIALEYTEDFYEKLAERALSYNIGVRGIGTAFEDVLEEIKLEDINPKEVGKIIFTGDVVNNPNAIVLVPRDVK